MAKHKNTFRNESVWVVDGEEYILRPTFDAIVKIEESTKAGSMQALLNAAIDESLTISDAAKVMAILSEAGGNPIDEEAIKEYCMEHGTAQICYDLALETLPKIVYGGAEYMKIMSKMEDAVATAVDNVQKKSSQSATTTKSQPASSD